MNLSRLIWIWMAVVGAFQVAPAVAQRVVRADHAPRGSVFIPNGNQWPQEVVGRMDLSTGWLWLDRRGWTAEVRGPGYEVLSQHGTPSGLASHVWRVRFEGGAADAPSEWRGRRSGERVNYYLSDDPAEWAEGLVPAAEHSREVWPGVQAVMRGGRKVKYEFKVAPGADPSVVVLRHEGTTPVLLPDGSLLHALGPQEAPWGSIVEGVPFAYQMNGSRIEEVACSYVVDGPRVRFELGTYDPGRELVIDPDLVFATYIGSTADSWGVTAGYDDGGRLIGGSGVLGAGYPTTPGAVSTTYAGGTFDIGITYFSADGSDVEVSTYIGGSEMEYPHSIVNDAEGDIFVMGTTGSANFPVTAGAYDASYNAGPLVNLAGYHFYGQHNNGCDLYVVKLSGATGAMLAGTFVGGTGNDGINIATELNYNYGDVCRGEIAVDSEGRPWVASTTRSADFPLVQAFDPALGGATDAVVFRLSADLADLEFSSYLGGSNDDAGYAMQFASDGSAAYITGGTRSTDFPGTAGGAQPAHAGGIDGFVTRLVPAGDGSWDPDGATYAGSSAYDQCYFVQLDTEDRPYVYGQTTGTLPLVGAVYSANPNGSSFVQRLAPDLSGVEFRTRVGLAQIGIDISPTAFLVSDCDEIYLSGWGGDTNNNSPYAGSSTTSMMPTTPDAEQLGTDGSDFWLGVLAPDGTDLTYGSFFGGPFSNEHVDGGTSRFDKDGTIYQAVCAGCGGGDDFPTTSGAWSELNLSTNCNLGVFKFNLGALVADIEIEAPDVICPGEPITFVNQSLGGNTYEWFFGDLNTSLEENPEYTYLESGEWDVILVVSSDAGSEGCLEPDTAFATVFVESLPTPSVDEVGPICDGESVQLQAWGGETLTWLPDPTLDDPSSPTPTVTPTETTTYTVEEENACGAATASVTVTVGVLEVEATPVATSICLGDVVEIGVSGVEPGAEVVWSPTGGLGSPTAATTSASPTETTLYTALVTDAIGCEGEATVNVTVVPSAPGGQVYPDVTLCEGQGTWLTASEGDTYLWSPAGLVSNPLAQEVYVQPGVETTFSVAIANLCGVGVDSVTVNFVAPEVSAAGGGWMCRGETMTLEASEGVVYSWQPAALCGTPSMQATTVFPVESTTFTVFVTDAFGCTASSTLEVGVWQPPYVDAGPNRELDWLDDARLFGTAEGDSSWWSPAELLSCSACPTPELLSSEPGWYVLSSISEEGCVGRDSAFVDVYYPIYVPNAFTPNNDGVNDAFFVEGVAPRGYLMEIYNRWGALVFRSEDPMEVWQGNDQQSGGEHYVPDGVYTWRVRYEMRDGPRWAQGHVSLIR